MGREILGEALGQDWVVLGSPCHRRPHYSEVISMTSRTSLGRDWALGPLLAS